MEAFDLAHGDLLEVHVGRIAKNLCEEVLLLFLVEQRVVIAVTAAIPLLVYPLQEQTLVKSEVRSLYKDLPQNVNGFSAERDRMVGV